MGRNKKEQRLTKEIVQAIIDSKLNIEALDDELEIQIYEAILQIVLKSKTTCFRWCCK
jgi:hypothetical protein